jgi:DMSO/TMAO reductase YedYZ molybdopterin-dependent catalytic subunit
VRTFRGAWSTAGLVAGFAGLATSYFVAMAMTIRDSPVVAVAEGVIRLTPGPVAEKVISVLGHRDKPFLVGVILVLVALLFVWAGRLAARAWWAPLFVFVPLAVLGAVAVSAQRGASSLDVLPVAVGFVTWLICLSLLTEPLRRAAAAEGEAARPAGERPGPVVRSRRSFLLRGAAIAAAAVALGAAGRVVGRGRRHVEETRRLLRLPGVTSPVVPARARIGLDGISPWMTPADEFYKIDTTIVAPAIEPVDWQLRIHGMVDRELVLSYQDLLDRRFTEGWVTLNCVSNPVGGPLIGNAWWGGVRLAGLLREAGVHPDADALKQTSDDGWTCGTPLAALTDNRNAMLAIAMNGEPLPIDHGFPVRTIVPGLYGYVSACKWVVDIEVTQFSQFSAYWTERGWGERGPVKLSSRIDVPASGGELSAGTARIGGVAWAQHVGVDAVEVALDGGDWQPAEISHPPTDDSWVQWAASVDVAPGDHVVRVRATDRNGLVQTGVERGVLPDGSTGWHAVDFTATS